MLHRKSILIKHKYFLKSIHGLWAIPIIMVNVFVPAVNFLLYKIDLNDMEINVEKILFFFLPFFSAWTSIFISELFFSEKTKDVFFFYGSRKKCGTAFFYFLLFLLDSVAVALLHFYCLGAYWALAFKIGTVAIFYFGAAMLILRCSKSAAITVMLLLLYDLANTSITGTGFFLLYENYGALDLPTALCRYLPLVLLGAVFLFIAFKTGRETATAKQAHPKA